GTLADAALECVDSGCRLSAEICPLAREVRALRSEGHRGGVGGVGRRYRRNLLTELSDTARVGGDTGRQLVELTGRRIEGAESATERIDASRVLGDAAGQCRGPGLGRRNPRLQGRETRAEVLARRGDRAS